MKSRLARALLIGGSAAVVVALGSASASAVTYTYTVTAGSAAVGRTVPITGTTTGATPQIKFTDTTAGVPLTCDSGSAIGSTLTGTGRSGLKIGTINGVKSKFNSCAGPFGLQFVVTGKSTWSLNATGKTSSTGITAGNISAISAHVADGTTCAFDVTGTVAGTFRNGTSAKASSLVLPGTVAALTLSHVTGSTCSLAGIANGDKASFKATYSIKANTVAYNPVAIKSE